jgi:hypothetical protein
MKLNAELNAARAQCAEKESEIKSLQGKLRAQPDAYKNKVVWSANQVITVA